MASPAQQAPRDTLTPSRLDAFLGMPVPNHDPPSSSLLDVFKQPAGGRSPNPAQPKHRRVSKHNSNERSSSPAGPEDQETKHETPQADGISPMKRAVRPGGGNSLLRTTLPTPRNVPTRVIGSGPGSALRASLAMSPGLWNPVRGGAPLSATRNDSDMGMNDDDEEGDGSHDRDSMLVFSSPQHPDLTQQLGLAPGSLLRSSGFGFPTPGNPFETPLRARAHNAFVLSTGPQSKVLDDHLWPSSIRPTPLAGMFTRRPSEVDPESPVSLSQRSMPAASQKSVVGEELDEGVENVADTDKLSPLVISTPLRRDWTSRSPLRSTPLRSTPLWASRANVPAAICKAPKSTGHSPSKSPLRSPRSPGSMRPPTVPSPLGKQRTDKALGPRPLNVNVPKV